MHSKQVGMVDKFYQPCHHPEQRWYISVSLMLSIGIHALVFWQWASMPISDVKASHQLAFVEVALLDVATAQELPQKDIQKEPLLEKKDSKVSKPQAPTLKPSKKVLKGKRSHVVKHAVHSSDLVKKRLSNHALAQNKATLEHMQQQYLSRIMASIQAHKSYPYSARRRHIEGDIHVSFVVDKLGQLHNLHITGGSAVLRLATQKAIDEAQPFPVPPQGSIRSQFKVQYRLN